jgi:hypothetical protein
MLDANERLKYLSGAFGTGNLGRDGVNASFRCPKCLHKDKFKLIVRLDNEKWHCWVCGIKGGSVASLLAKHAKEYRSGWIQQFGTVEQKRFIDEPEEEAVRLLFFDCFGWSRNSLVCFIFFFLTNLDATGEPTQLVSSASASVSEKDSVPSGFEIGSSGAPSRTTTVDVVGLWANSGNVSASTVGAIGICPPPIGPVSWGFLTVVLTGPRFVSNTLL